MRLKQGAPKQLHEARERAGLSRTDLETLTEDAGYRISSAAIYNLEKGKTPTPYLRTLMTLAQVLGLTVDELVESEPEEVSA